METVERAVSKVLAEWFVARLKGCASRSSY